jgi:arginase family enzyme
MNLSCNRILLSLLLSASVLLGAAVCARASSIPGWKVINLDIDHSVSSQKGMDPFIDERKDLHSSENQIRLWTNSKGLKVLRSSIADLRQKYPSEKWLTFVGSGDFHQVAATLIDALPKSAQPVTVVMFDNHPDWFKAPAHYHCGAWVVQALRNPGVERVILVGQNSSDIRGDQFRFAPFHELCKGRVEVYPAAKKGVLVPLIWVSKVAGVESSKRSLCGTQLRFSTVEATGAQAFGERLAKQLAGKNVYFSIDKDVLCESDALTDWDQGLLTLKDLLAIISKVSDQANVVGMDVCGERAPEPVHGILKSLDCGREFKRKIKNFAQANEVNQRTNLTLVKSVSESASASKQVHAQIEGKRK